LFSLTRKPKCSIRFFIEQGDDRLFSLPLSQQAAAQLDEIETFMQSRTWDENVNDIWSYTWGSSRFSSKKAYGALIGHTESSPLFKWLWGSDNLGKHKFFFWLLLRDRLNTRNILRKNMALDDYNCVLCNLGCEETNFHLFFECSFSRDCWATIPINWNLSLSPLDMILQARADFNNAIFIEIAITACRVIWNTRNDVIFDNGQINIHLWKRQFKEEFGLVCTKARASRQVHLSAWRDSYL
jgi:hypothetical protein